MNSMYIYILTNKHNNVFYIGVTNNLIRRIYEHRNHMFKGFSDKYNVEKLVYYECYSDKLIAIQREKNLKHYTKQWKIDLINKFNPEWKDLYSDIIS